MVSPIKRHGSIDQGIQQHSESPAVHLVKTKTWLQTYPFGYKQSDMLYIWWMSAKNTQRSWGVLCKLNAVVQTLLWLVIHGMEMWNELSSTQHQIGAPRNPLDVCSEPNKHYVHFFFSHYPTTTLLFKSFWHICQMKWWQMMVGK